MKIIGQDFVTIRVIFTTNYLSFVIGILYYCRTYENGK